MSDDPFLRELDDLIARTLADGVDAGRVDTTLGVAPLLATALKKELEAAEEAALWLVAEGDLEVKLALMRQCGDEAKHYRLVEKRLRELGAPIPSPDEGGKSPMFAYLAELPSTIERVAAGPYAREALAKAQNEAFIAHCEARGDHETAALYRDVIQPDELHHHRMGRTLLARLCVTDEDRRKARAAVERTLAIGGTIREKARARGIVNAPGC